MGKHRSLLMTQLLALGRGHDTDMVLIGHGCREGRNWSQPSISEDWRIKINGEWASLHSEDSSSLKQQKSHQTMLWRLRPARQAVS